MRINVQVLEDQLNHKLAESLHIESITPVAGGDICESFKVECKTKTYFLKVHHPGMHAMLQGEAQNLRALAETMTLRVPLPVAHGQTGTYCYLLLEFLELQPAGSDETLGRLLAQLHQYTESYYGWFEDNWIGTTPQLNTKNADWVSFWRHRRLAYQLNLAKHNGAPRELLEQGDCL